MAKIHPTAIVDAGAELAETVEVGPYSVIGPHVRLGAGTRVMSHAVVDGWTTLGEGCTVFPFASVGQQTQDLKFKGGAPRVEIGDRTTIREFVTIHAATNDGDATKIGNDNLIMAYAHVAHDCIVGDGVILANCATLAGHVVIQDQVGVGGLVGVHQFVRLGRLSYIGGFNKVVQDVPPFMLADGNPLAVRALNSVGLKRRGISEQAQALLKKCYKMLYMEDLSTRQALEKMEAEVEKVPEVEELIGFIRSSERGITR